MAWNVPTQRSLREVVAQEAREAGAHLAGGLVRERDGEDAVRRDPRARDEVRDAVGDDAGLAAARAGEHEQGAARVRDGVGLRGVQLGIGGRDLSGLGRRHAECPTPYEEARRSATGKPAGAQGLRRVAAAAVVRRAREPPRRWPREGL